MTEFVSSTDYLSDGYLWAESVIFSNQPTHYTLHFEELRSFVHEYKSVLNYSQVYEKCSAGLREHLIAPNKINTGDIVQINPGPRGVGAHYAVWLCKDLIQHDLSKLNLSDSDYDAQSGQKKQQLSESQGGLLDPFTWGLSEPQLKNLRRILALDYEELEKQLQDFLLPNYPELCQEIREDANMHYYSAVSALRFASDHPKVYEGDEEDENSMENDENGENDEDGEELEYFTAYGTTPNASQHLSLSTPPLSYPCLLSRRELSSLSSNPAFSLYLFPHQDEYGYAAPTVCSSVQLNYFNWEYNARNIDLSLLPPPLDKQTRYGYVLNKIREKIPVEERKEDEVIEVDFEGEDAVVYWERKVFEGELEEEEEREEEEEDEEEDNEDDEDEEDEKAEGGKGVKAKKEGVVTLTRRLFAEHGEKMREKVAEKMKERGWGEVEQLERLRELVREILGV